MSLKSWVFERVRRMNGLVARADLPPREPVLSDAALRDAPQIEPMLSSAQHLGAYAVLVGAIRDELEHFVVGHVRLHLAIADRDRFVLTSIGVRCADDGQARELLARFMREFKPEQIKRYLAREVIAGLPNASAIDLSQFAGLLDADAGQNPDEYGELLVALRGDATPPAASAFQVSILGRWSEIDASAGGASASQHQGAATPATPLAGLRCEFEIEDGNGRRRVVLPSVIAGRRYMIGKDESCDLRLEGTYTSRRHAEIWLENGDWWVADAGSTNGIRLESASGAIDRSGAGATARPLRLADGARIVLSAHAEGATSEYPAVALRTAPHRAARPTPIAGAVPSPTTPLTPIVPPPAGAENAFTLTARSASGERRLELQADMLPIAVGRSRNQQLVIDRIYETVSGHHIDIVDVGASSARVVVQGDNGVIVEGVTYPTGAVFRWNIGDTMVLGPALQDEPACTLVLARTTKSELLG